MELPPELAKLSTLVGSHRKAMKILAWGESKAGKSYFLASFPKPIFAFDAGEQGIQQYLDPKQDVCLQITDPESLLKAEKFLLQHQSDFASVVLDPLTVIWEDWMDYWNDALGGDIKGGSWKKVKAPWKILMRELQRSGVHVGFSAWIDDLFYDIEQVEGPPGVETKSRIKGIYPQERPKTEKRVPHHLDMFIQFSIKRDKLYRPTPIHVATYTGGRRPKNFPPQELYVGKTWTFDERKPESPWEKIIQPILERWGEGAVDSVGIANGVEDAVAEKEVFNMGQDYALGALVKLIESQTNLHEFANKVWPETIEPHIAKMDKERVDILVAAKDRKKQELMR